jgi:hypothetical protein
LAYPGQSASNSALIIGSQIAKLILIPSWTDLGCSVCLVDVHLFAFSLVAVVLILDGPPFYPNFKSQLSLPDAHENSKTLLYAK